MARGAAADPSSEARLLVEAANVYDAHGQTEEALAWFERATKAYPGFIEGQAGKAYLLLRQGKMEGSRRIFSNLIATAPGAHDGYWGLALVAQEAEDSAEAERCYRAGAEHAAYWRHRFLARAIQLAWRRDHEERAIADMLAVVAESRYDELVIDAAEGIADELNGDRGVDVACAYCERLRAAAGSKYETRLQAKLGDLQAAAGRLPQAVARHREATKLAPADAGVWVRLARTLRRLHEWEGSRGLFEAAPAEVQADESFLTEMSLLRNAEGNELFGRGKFAEAIPLYKAAIEHAPRDAVLLANLARAWEADRSTPPLQRIDAALDAIGRAVALAPDNAEYAERRDRLARQRSFARDLGAAFDFVPMATPIGLEVSADLIQLFESPGGALTTTAAGALAALRTRIEKGYGVSIPSVLVRGHETDLPPDTYIIVLKEVAAVSGTVRRDRRLAIATPDRLRDLGIAAEPATDLATGQEAAWISEADRATAEQASLESLDAVEAVLHHLQAVIERSLADFFGHQELRNRLSNSKSMVGATLIDRPGLLTELTRLSLLAAKNWPSS